MANRRLPVFETLQGRDNPSRRTVSVLPQNTNSLHAPLLPTPPATPPPPAAPGAPLLASIAAPFLPLRFPTSSPPPPPPLPPIVITPQQYMPSINPTLAPHLQLVDHTMRAYVVPSSVAGEFRVQVLCDYHFYADGVGVFCISAGSARVLRRNMSTDLHRVQ